ncbi:hypothetical protein Rsub_13328 [Raphidocelis subcapitata]|uniref:Uncharacterized protein n=1 Tax=Raphidocelis subcapitata TaxID=307507 RepID=A0A2V0PN83_9CHLO|nr:hypothetical protein Rsub_13328 [Raphidocelis subcapitata]|eukprot:GBG00583.1 hypothetical protein Rsub_13328 [Raphidocelis subcapitata]
MLMLAAAATAAAAQQLDAAAAAAAGGTAAAQPRDTAAAAAVMPETAAPDLQQPRSAPQEPKATAAAPAPATAHAAPQQPEPQQPQPPAAPPAAAAAAAAPAGPAPGTVAQLWSWWPASGRAAPPGATPAYSCLANAFSGGPRDASVFSQVGEDGILSAIFSCIGEGGKYYVELGTENATVCSTRYLREHKGWSGLLLDGGHSNPDINLHAEYLRSKNVVRKFKKHGVPYPGFDHMTVDIDLNTFWAVRRLLGFGYRPRSLAVEYNRNFRPTQAYATPDLPSESWGGSCYFGASGLAMERLMRAFGYSLVAFDSSGVNLFFVDDAQLGVPLPLRHTFASLSQDPAAPAWAPIHAPCAQSLWLRVGGGAGLAEKEYMRHLLPVVLGHRDGAGSREFYEAESTGALLMHRRVQRARLAGGGGGGGEGLALPAEDGGGGGGGGGVEGLAAAAHRAA